MMIERWGLGPSNASGYVRSFRLSGPVPRVRRLVLALLGALLLTGLPAALVSAQDRASLTRVLQHSGDFRVRVQAAFALGNLGDPQAVPTLERGLRDQNPAVRAACATALGRLGSARALSALRRAQNDPSPAVRMQAESSIRAIRSSSGSPVARRAVRIRRGGPTYPSVTVVPSEDRIVWPRVRYVVVLGNTQNRSAARFGGLSSQLRAEVADQLRVLRGIAVVSSERSLDRRAQQEIRRRGIPVVRLEAALSTVRESVRRGELQVRVEVALMMFDGRSDAIRGELRGAATGAAPGRRGQRDRVQALAEQALSGAVRSAMSGAAQAIAQATRR